MLLCYSYLDNVKLLAKLMLNHLFHPIFVSNVLSHDIRVVGVKTHVSKAIIVSDQVEGAIILSHCNLFSPGLV